jgi:hypothetical protein
MAQVMRSTWTWSLLAPLYHLIVYAAPVIAGDGQAADGYAVLGPACEGSPDASLRESLGFSRGWARNRERDAGGEEAREHD